MILERGLKYFFNFSYFMQMAMASGIDCGDKTCDVEYRLLPNCVIYVDNDEQNACQYPCSFLNCKTELHAFTVCPIWSCSEKSTTTPSPPLPTLVPFPTSSSNGSLTTSIVFNVLFGMIILALVGLYLLRRRQNQRLTAYISATNPLFESGFDLFSNQRPIIRNSERDLLIPRSPPRRNSNPPTQVPSQIPNFYAGPEAAVLPVSSNVQETSF